MVLSCGQMDFDQQVLTQALLAALFRELWRRSLMQTLSLCIAKIRYRVHPLESTRLVAKKQASAVGSPASPITVGTTGCPSGVQLLLLEAVALL